MTKPIRLKPPTPPQPPPAPVKLLAAPKAASLNMQAKKLMPSKPAPIKGKSHTALDRTEPLGPGNYLGDVEKPGESEVRIIEHMTTGRRELDRVCQDKGLHFGILYTSSISPGNGKPDKLKVFILVGSQYEFEVENTSGYPQAVDEALRGLAAEIESE